MQEIGYFKQFVLFCREFRPKLIIWASVVDIMPMTKAEINFGGSAVRTRGLVDMSPF